MNFKSNLKKINLSTRLYHKSIIIYSYNRNIHSKCLRIAQTTENFRSCYYKASNASLNLSLSDIDQLIITERVRPSILIEIYSKLGQITGNLNKFNFSSEMKQIIDESVDDACIQLLNDSVRELNHEQDVDIKETLKFHRDLRNSSDCRNIHEEGDENKKNNKNDKTFCSNLPIYSKTLLTTGLYQFLKVSDCI